MSYDSYEQVVEAMNDGTLTYEEAVKAFEYYGMSVIETTVTIGGLEDD